MKQNFQKSMENLQFKYLGHLIVKLILTFLSSFANWIFNLKACIFIHFKISCFKEDTVNYNENLWRYEPSLKSSGTLVSVSLLTLPSQSISFTWKSEKRAFIMPEKPGCSLMYSVIPTSRSVSWSAFGLSFLGPLRWNHFEWLFRPRGKPLLLLRWKLFGFLLSWDMLVGTKLILFL